MDHLGLVGLGAQLPGLSAPFIGKPMKLSPSTEFFD
jgi:hypothetical protein